MNYVVSKSFLNVNNNQFYISNEYEEDSESGSEIEDDIFDEYEEEEESREIPFLVEETEHSRKVEEEGEDDFPDTASIIYGGR